MQEGGGVFAEGEDTEGHKLELGVRSGGCIGRNVQAAGKVQEVVARAAGVLGDLEKDLVHEGCSHIGHGQCWYCAEDANWIVSADDRYENAEAR